MARIVLAEDDRTTQMIVVDTLENAGHTVTVCPNGRHAWETLEVNEAVDVLITDVMMPELDGRDLIRKIRKHPVLKDLPIIIISGVIKASDVMDLLETGATYFMPKPLDGDELEAYVQCCLKEREHIKKKYGARPLTLVDEIMRKVQYLPPLSSSATELLRLSERHEMSAQDMAAIVQRDPVLVAQVLRTANSAAYRKREPITSVPLAVSILGNMTVFGIALGYCMSGVFDRPLNGYEAGESALWKNALCTAIAARLLAPHAREDVNPETAYTAGLLHDIGKMIISEYLKGRTNRLVATVDEGAHKQFLDAEIEQLGIDHAATGAAIARHWKLPEPIIEAMARHHQPGHADVQHPSLVYTVHLASLVSMMVGAETGADAMLYNMDSQCPYYLPIDPHEFDRIVMKTENEYNTVLAGTQDHRTEV